MEMTSEILRHEVNNLREVGKKIGTVHERDLQALHFGMSMTEEDWNRLRKSFEVMGIRVIPEFEGESILLPQPWELTEAFREDDAVMEYLRVLQEEGFGLTPEREADFARRGIVGTLVYGNLLRVVSIARQYMGQGMNACELLCAGNQALVDAAWAWNTRLNLDGCPITLYLVYHIRRGICAALAWPEEKEVRNIMETLREQMAEIPDFDAIFRRQNSRLPVIGENPILSRLKMRVVEYPDLMSPREMEVVRLRLGLTDGISHTVEEVAECFGITPERVAQIENKFLRLVRRARRGEWTIMDSEIEQ